MCFAANKHGIGSIHYLPYMAISMSSPLLAFFWGGGAYLSASSDSFKKMKEIKK